MQQPAVCAQNMTTPYMLWPYVPISPLTSSPDIPVFQGQFLQNGATLNEMHSHFLPPHLYANNVVLQNYRHQQQQVMAKQIDNVIIQNVNLHQNHERALKANTDLNCNLPVVTADTFDSPPRRRRLSASTRNRSSPTSAKRGLFTIDAILNKNNEDNEKLQEEEECPSPMLSPVPKRQHQHGNSSSSDNWLSSSSDLSSPKIAEENPTRGANCIAPLLHSTPVNYRVSGAVSPRRQGSYIEAHHPYFPKHLDVYQSHLYSYQQHHQNLLAQMSPQPSNPRSSFSSSSLPPSVSLSSSSSPASSSSPSAASLSSSQNDKSDRKSKNKRIRTIFTPEQLERLEAEFERQQYMVGTERFYLASSLHLTEAQVKVWFQNRRIKWRKQHLEQQQARLAQGDLYRDIEDSGDSDLEEDVLEPMTSASSQDDVFTNESSNRSDVD